ncbi:hypothetical protein U728_765 [Clostridium botulinum 202F]|nr:hypothetical protein U728_765 [Clostridium botulinum 202F]KON14713.1 hypothetical protein ACP50_00760 [Clostridium botulinum]MBY6988465.1 hypothetical protein [Clostridium botulinum]NFH01687.1 hypothetical protein [Clostridium botulinum]NFP41035.1 hypothetical protein [Clostridium botulinum]
MNKFQKVAYQIAKDDAKKEIYKGQSVVKRSRLGYAVFAENKDSWPYKKCVDLKNWSKNKSW